MASCLLDFMPFDRFVTKFGKDRVGVCLVSVQYSGLNALIRRIIAGGELSAACMVTELKF